MPRVPPPLLDSVGEGRGALVIAEGLHEIVLGPRVALDLLVTVDSDLLVFLCVDGEVLIELATAGVA